MDIEHSSHVLILRIDSNWSISIREKYSGGGVCTSALDMDFGCWIIWIKPTSGLFWLHRWHSFFLFELTDFIIILRSILRAKSTLYRCCVGCSLFVKQNELNWIFKIRMRRCVPKLVEEVAPLVPSRGLSIRVCGQESVEPQCQNLCKSGAKVVWKFGVENLILFQRSDTFVVK